jgi:peptidoglycan/xylan/chitin deacetylase (PgdA/CDA1 family)
MPAVSDTISRRDLFSSAAASAACILTVSGASEQVQPAPRAKIPDKLVVLTFDDAVKSHRTVVAPLLKDLGFGATFFVTHAWMDDKEHFMSWNEIAELHAMGFEIGNHSWTHPNFGDPAIAARMPEELGRVEDELQKVGVPRPISFAYCGNGFGPEAVEQLKVRGFGLARRGMQPEKPYGKIEIGPAFNPREHHPLLIPTTGDAYPTWTIDHFKRVVAEAKAGRSAVLQFHGVPDIAHPWVHTPPERFREYLDLLKVNGYRAVALRDLIPFLDLDHPPADPMLKVRFPQSKA